MIKNLIHKYNSLDKDEKGEVIGATVAVSLFALAILNIRNYVEFVVWLGDVL